MTNAQRMVALGKGIPSAFMVQDPVARGVLEALREAVLMLTSTLALGSNAAAVPAAASSFVDAAKLIEQGTYISVVSLGNGKVRISCTIAPSAPAYGNGGGSGGDSYDLLSKLLDVEIDEPADGDAVVYDDTDGKWKNAPQSGGGLPDGNALGQIAHWDTVTGAWVVSVVGALSEGDMLKWDATNKKFVKVSMTAVDVVVDNQIETTGKLIQHKKQTIYVPSAGAAGSFATITNGAGEEGVIP